MFFNIKGAWIRDGEEESFEYSTKGSLLREDDRYTLKYNEAGIFGGEGDTVTIEVDKGSVLMHKTGANTTQMLFEQNKTYSAIYETPFGAMNVSFLPTVVETDMGEEAGRINLEYILNLEGSHAVNRLDLSYMSESTTQAEV